MPRLKLIGPIAVAILGAAAILPLLSQGPLRAQGKPNVVTTVAYVDTLRDDDLPGAPDARENSYVEMLREDVATITEALGGDPSALATVDPANTFQP